MQTIQPDGSSHCYVSPQWGNWVKHKHITDSMGMKAINLIDIKVRNYVVRSIKVCLVPTSATLGKATIHSLITSYQHSLLFIDFMLHLTQLNKSRKKLSVIVQGEVN
jgi:hypothetical protein